MAKAVPRPVPNRKHSEGAAAAASSVPAPFTLAPKKLSPFTERLDPAKVYLTHIDSHATEHKRLIFTIPVLLNATIALLLLWRVYYAAPQYVALIETALGRTSSATVDIEHTTRRRQFDILFRRTTMLIFDFFLFRIVGPWPLSFFLQQPANPVTWRWRLGFRPQEVIVRESRGWVAGDLVQGVKRGEENAFFKTRILPAISKERLRKTGYVLMDASWDLEFELMQDAHALDEKFGKLKIADLDKMVFVNLEGLGWAVWNWESESQIVEARRRQVVAFKEKLTAMGKESLFWTWTEIVEEERAEDGSFPLESQKRLADRVKRLFDEHGVDFEQLTKEVGGLDELPLK